MEPMYGQPLVHPKKPKKAIIPKPKKPVKKKPPKKKSSKSRK